MLRSYKHARKVKETFLLQQESVHVDEVLHTHKLKNVASNLKTNALSQTTLEKYLVRLKLLFVILQIFVLIDNYYHVDVCFLNMGVG